MNDEGKTKEQLVNELKELREELAFFKALSAENIPIARVLKDFKEIHENFYKSNPHPMWIYDLETLTFLDVNDAAVQRYGYSEEEFLSMTIRNIRPPGDIPALLENIAKVTKGLDIAGTWRHIKKDGTLIQVEIISHTLTFMGKRAEMVLALDITERKRMEEELIELRQQIHNFEKLQIGRKQAEELIERLYHQNELVLNAAGEGIFGLDIQGKHTFVNPVAAQMLGYTVNELIGRHSHTLWHYKKSDGSSYPVEECPIYAAYKDGKVHHKDDEVFWRKDGTCFPVAYTSTPIMEDGNIVGAVVTFRDITERKQAEEKLKKLSDELARSNADLQQFAYTASHDLQEPIMVVAGFVKLLAKRYKGKLDEKADEFIEHAIDGTERMQVLIKDLLDYSRVGSTGKSFTPTDCLSALDKAVFNLQIAIKESGAVITHDNLPTIMADSSQLARLFQNLISNAIKFRGKEAPKIHISAKQKEGERIFSIKDNGIGIDSKFLEQIFVMFQRLYTKKEYPGTGIGLATCKKIVERHGGRIWVESEQGKGSTFYFTIPNREDNA
jgi:PAS domain S-box-containing protein